MQKPRNAWIHYILAIHKGKEGHWVLIKGVKLCDTYSEGRWQFVCDGPHKGGRIMEVFEVAQGGVSKAPASRRTSRRWISAVWVDRRNRRHPSHPDGCVSSSTWDPASRAGCRRTG